jgi:hypothetical protein
MSLYVLKTIITVFGSVGEVLASSGPFTLRFPHEYLDWFEWNGRRSWVRYTRDVNENENEA